MSKLVDALKAGAKAAVAAIGPGSYAVAGIQVRCNHCGGFNFDLRDAGTFVGPLARIASFSLRCEACTHIMLFDAAPERL